MQKVGFQPLESATLAAQIQARLEEAIYTGQLKPGQRLIETDLAEALQVSRASFREALRLLQSKGLVVTTHRRGTFVAEITATDVRDIYTLRILLEGFAIRQATEQPHQELLERLDQLIEQLRQCAERRDHIGIVDLDVEFHRTICEATGNKKLLEHWEALVSPVRAFLLTKYRIFDDSPEIAQGHERLVDAIRVRKPDLAEELLKSHIIDTAEEVLRILALEETDGNLATGGNDGTHA
jgi:DNA-binding GntR family transcriptional regulator